MTSELTTEKPIDYRPIRERYRKVRALTQDIMVNTGQCRFHYAEENKPCLEVEGVGDLILNERSYKQLAQRCEGMSASYFQRWEPAEQEQHFNRWLQELDTRFLLRTARNNLRAVLPEDFAILDNITLLELFIPYVDSGEMQVVAYVETDAKVFFRFRFPQDLSRMQDPVFGGISSQNSEVGSCKYSMDFMLYRQVCANGMVHRVGGEPLMSHQHLYLQPHEFTVQVKDAIERARQLQYQLASSFEAAREIPLTDEQLKNLLAEFKQTRIVPKRLIDRLEKEPFEHTWFHLINEVTRHAQAFRMDRRVTIEQTAGALLQRTAALIDG